MKLQATIRDELLSAALLRTGQLGVVVLLPAVVLQQALRSELQFTGGLRARGMAVLGAQVPLELVLRGEFCPTSLLLALNNLTPVDCFDMPGDVA